MMSIIQLIKIKIYHCWINIADKTLLIVFTSITFNVQSPLISLHVYFLVTILVTVLTKLRFIITLINLSFRIFVPK
jgi:hypothetical protein